MVELKVSRFSGEPEEYEEFYAELMSEEVEEPHFFITEFENEALSLASNDSLDSVDLGGLEEHGMELFRRPFVGSLFPVLEDNFHFALQVPNSVNFRTYFENQLGPAVESSLRSLGVEGSIRYAEQDDLSVRVNGMPIAGMNERGAKSSVYAGFITVESWDALLLEDIFDLREGEADFIEEMPSLNDYGDYSSKDFGEAFLENMGAKETEYGNIQPYFLNGGESMRATSSDLSYQGFCPVTAETLRAYSESS